MKNQDTIENTVVNVGSDALIIRSERGWAGHFICAHHCLFRRNTLLECGEIRIVVSTVGLMKDPLCNEKFVDVGWQRAYETMAFHAAYDGRYWDANVNREVSFESPWSIRDMDADDKANDMHETVVAEIYSRLSRGETFAKQSV